MAGFKKALRQNVDVALTLFRTVSGRVASLRKVKGQKQRSKYGILVLCGPIGFGSAAEPPKAT